MANNRKNGLGRKIGLWVLLLVALGVIFGAGAWLGGTYWQRGGGAGHAEHSADEPKVAKATKWTCSMHPSIDMEVPGVCPICGMELIPKKDTGELLGLRQITVSDTARELMKVEVRPVERRFIPKAVRMVGKVDFDETRLAYITAWIPGRLDRLYVDYTGVPVRKGDHLAELYSPELLSAQESLLQALDAVKNVAGSESSYIKESATATVKATQEKLRLWGLTPPQIAEIEQSGKVSDHITIYAPSGGIVIHKNALEGMYVKEGSQIYTIADLSQVWVKLDAYESDLDWLRYGQKVSFTAVSYPGEVFYGTIAFIDPILNERTRTVKVRVNVANTDGRLKPEMFVKAQVRSEVAGGGKVRMDPEMAGKWMCPMHPSIIKEQAGPCDICEMPLVTIESLGYVNDISGDDKMPLVVPASAVLLTGTRAVVYVKVEGARTLTYEGREIVPGPRVGDYYVVRSGLTEGEQVVVKGNFKIDSDLQIMARPSMMTPDAGVAGEKLSDLDKISGLVAFQLEAVVKAGRKISHTLEHEGLVKAKASFDALGITVKAVEGDVLTGDAKRVWAELKMRLDNDAVEGGQVKSLEEAGRVVAGMDKNLKLLQIRFGLELAAAKGERVMISKAFSQQLSEVFGQYFAMRKALAEDRSEEATGAVRAMLASLKNVDMGLVSGQDHDVWMKAHDQLKKVLVDAMVINDLARMRESFHLVSQTMIQLAGWFGSVGDGPVYVYHCPMAFENTGANWLQADDKTLNPYFGAMMLRCGGVTRVIGQEEIWK
ncbi:MAG: efflux RND transporter periplasmic adaptor subunit [Phycisphaerae bacterium]|nr:efflux RND transporter periplasmic adaptor subunit [Phycisphaerae bacterium]